MDLDEKKINRLVRLLELDTGVDVEEATTKNKEHEVIKKFLKEHNIEAGPYDIQSEKLYRLFRKWYEGDQPPTKTMFGRFVATVLPRVRLAKGKFYKINRKTTND